VTNEAVEDHYDLTVGDGEEHYIILDKAHPDSSVKITTPYGKLFSDTIGNGRGMSAELVKLDNGLDAIRISGGKDFVAYTNLSADYDVNVELSSDASYYKRVYERVNRVPHNNIYNYKNNHDDDYYWIFFDENGTLKPPFYNRKITNKNPDVNNISAHEELVYVRNASIPHNSPDPTVQSLLDEAIKNAWPVIHDGKVWSFYLFPLIYASEKFNAVVGGFEKSPSYINLSESAIKSDLKAKFPYVVRLYMGDIVPAYGIYYGDNYRDTTVSERTNNVNFLCTSYEDIVLLTDQPNVPVYRQQNCTVIFDRYDYNSSSFSTVTNAGLLFILAYRPNDGFLTAKNLFGSNRIYEMLFKIITPSQPAYENNLLFPVQGYNYEIPKQAFVQKENMSEINDANMVFIPNGAFTNKYIFYYRLREKIVADTIMNLSCVGNTSFYTKKNTNDSYPMITLEKIQYNRESKYIETYLAVYADDNTVSDRKFKFYNQEENCFLDLPNEIKITDNTNNAVIVHNYINNKKWTFALDKLQGKEIIDLFDINSKPLEENDDIYKNNIYRRKEPANSIKEDAKGCIEIKPAQFVKRSSPVIHSNNVFYDYSLRYMNKDIGINNTMSIPLINIRGKTGAGSDAEYIYSPVYSESNNIINDQSKHDIIITYTNQHTSVSNQNKLVIHVKHAVRASPMKVYNWNTATYVSNVRTWDNVRDENYSGENFFMKITLNAAGFNSVLTDYERKRGKVIIDKNY
jgi:hypothetical protein